MQNKEIRILFKRLVRVIRTNAHNGLSNGVCPAFLNQIVNGTGNETHFFYRGERNVMASCNMKSHDIRNYKNYKSFVMKIPVSSCLNGYFSGKLFGRFPTHCAQLKVTMFLVISYRCISHSTFLLLVKLIFQFTWSPHFLQYTKSGPANIIKCSICA